MTVRTEDASTTTVAVALRIRRFDPEGEQRRRWDEHSLDARPTDRVLDLLDHVEWERDGSLAYRRSCGHGVCGSDACPRGIRIAQRITEVQSYLAIHSA